MPLMLPVLSNQQLQNKLKLLPNDQEIFRSRRTGFTDSWEDIISITFQMCESVLESELIFSAVETTTFSAPPGKT